MRDVSQGYMINTFSLRLDIQKRIPFLDYLYPLTIKNLEICENFFGLEHVMHIPEKVILVV